MHITSDKDFQALRRQFVDWRKRFPMFTHDVASIEQIIEKHIQDYSKHLVNYRQTRSKSHLERAQQELDAINQVLALVEKMELMSMLSR
jgi:hypothetical protein